MSKVVRMTSDDPVSPETQERLRRLAEMSDEEIRTDLIPERRFNIPLAIARRKAGWKPGIVKQKKAS